jgi:hypothetical protein
MLIVCLNVICQGGGSNLYPPSMEGTFTPEEIQDRIFGSKIVVVSEQAMLNVIYTIKVCVLIMYGRLTLGLNTVRWVRVLAWYVGVGWVATELAFFTACRPFSGYWGMPPPDPQCTTLEYYAYVQGCFNISSDICMLFIPLPLIFRLYAPWRQKIVLVLIFGLGLFVIVAALLTKIFNLSDIWDPSYMLWYTREASVAVYVANLPMIWPLLRDWFPCLRSLTPGGNSNSYGRNGNKQAKGQQSAGAQLTGGSRSGPRSAAAAVQGKARDILVARRSRVMGNHRRSQYSLDEEYEMDLEAGSKDGEADLRRDGQRSSDGDSSTSIVGGRGKMSEDIARGIKVEHTIVVEAVRSPRQTDEIEEGAQAVYDWMHAGTAEHSVRATGGR